MSVEYETHVTARCTICVVYGILSCCSCRAREKMGATRASEVAPRHTSMLLTRQPTSTLRHSYLDTSMLITLNMQKPSLAYTSKSSHSCMRKSCTVPRMSA